MMVRKINLARGVLAVVGIVVGYVWAAGRGEVGGDIVRERVVAADELGGEEVAWDELNDEQPWARDSLRLALVDSLSVGEIKLRLGELEMPKDYEIAEALLQQLAGSDGAQAVELLDGLWLGETGGWRTGPNSARIYHRLGMRATIVSEWLKNDEAGAIEHLERWTAGLPEWSPDAKSLLKQVSYHLGADKREVTQVVARVLKISDWEDPVAANSLQQKLEKFANPETRDRGEFDGMLQLEARRDPEAVFEALMEMPDDTVVEDRNIWMGSVYSGERLLQLRRKFAVEKSEEEWSEELVKRESAGGVQEWASRRPEEALGWVAALPEGAEREHLRASALVGVALQKPEWALEQMEGLPEKKRVWAMRSMAGEWHRRDPVAATAWVESLDEPKLQKRLLEQLPD